MYLQALTLIFSLSNTICISNNAEFFIFKTIPSIGDKISIQPAIFYSNYSSSIQCVHRCTTTHGCVSVFYSADSICQGYLKVFDTNSPTLVSNPGVVYYVSKDHAEISCEAIGYTWNPALYICYKVHTDPKLAIDAIAQCNIDHPNSRLLLVDSDALFDFHLKIMETYQYHTLYTQGTRPTGSTNYVDDDGQIMTYFKWAVNEPDVEGNYLRTDDETLLQETSVGDYPYNFICRHYGVSSLVL